MNEEVTFSILYHDLLDKLVWVEWIDSMVSNGWTVLGDSAHLKPMPRINSIGKLIADETDYIVIVADFHEDEYNRCMRIPKGCIKDIQQVKIG